MVVYVFHVVFIYLFIFFSTETADSPSAQDKYYALGIRTRKLYFTTTEQIVFLFFFFRDPNLNKILCSPEEANA